MKGRLFSLVIALTIISVVGFSMSNKHSSLNTELVQSQGDSGGISLPAPLSDDDFIVQSKNTFIELDCKLEMEEALGCF